MTRIPGARLLTCGLLAAVLLNGSSRCIFAQSGNNTFADLSLVDPTNVPPDGTFFSLSTFGLYSENSFGPPTPWSPCPECNTYYLGINVALGSSRTNAYVVDDTSVSIQSGAQRGMTEESFTSNDGPETPDGLETIDYGTNLFLEIPAVTNGTAFVILHNVSQGEVYELMSSVALPAARWNPEQALFTVSNQNWISTTVPILDRTNALFFWARDWTGIDENSNSVADWWEWTNYGPPVAFSQTLHTMTNTPLNVFLQASNPESLPLTYIFLSGPTSGVLSNTPPNLTYTPATNFDGPDGFTFQVTDGAFWSQPASVTISVDTAIAFFIASSPEYIGSPALPIQLNVTAGVPREMAVLIDSTNFAAADWEAYSSSNVTVNPGSAQGWHELWIGLRGATQISPQVWRWTRFKSDWTPPLLIITNPIAATISRPMIQLQGYCPEPLASISFDLTNAAGVFTNQPVLLLDRWFDTNVWEFTTNIFQAFDVPLTNGLNRLTLHATDLAGNTTNQTLNLTLDYSSKTNPPVVRLYWPLDGAYVASTSNYTCRGWVDDFTASVTANVTDANGNTSPFSAVVERDGKFWIQNLDLTSGTNTIRITVQDAAGNVSVTNATVVANSIGLTVDGYQAAPFSPTMPTTYVWGSIGSTNCTVWVNGVRAQLDGDGGWQATNAPVPSGGTYLFQARAIPNTDNGGNGSGSGNFSPDYSNSGNPASSQAADAELQEDKPSMLYLASYKYSQNETRSSLRQQFCGVFHALIFTLEDNDFWDTQFSYQDSGPSHKSAISTGDNFYNGNETYGNCDQETSWNTWDYSQLYGGTLASITTTCDVTNINTGSDNIDKPLASRFCDEKVITDTDGDVYDGSGCNSHITTHDKINQQEQYSAKFFTGGKSVAGAMKVFGIYGSAHKLEFVPVDPGARQLSPGEFTIGGFGSPDSDSYRYVSLAADQTVDVTAKAKVNYYDGGASATEVKLRIYDANTGDELTDKTITAVVGQQVNLYCTVSAPTPIQPTAYQWTVPGFAISNYIVTATSATVFSNFPTTLSNVVFYWVDGATNRALSCSAIVRGQKVAGQVTFNIYRPKVTFTDLPPSWATNYGGFLALGESTGEIYYNVNVASVFAGKTDFTQLINRTAANGRTSETTDYQFWLDSYPFYLSRANDAAYQVTSNRPRLLQFNDSPGYELSHLFSNTTSIFDQFNDYIMFRPDTGIPANNIYVPLGKMIWSWSASTTYSGGQWSPPTKNIRRPTVPDGGYEFPQWPQVYSNPK